MGVSAGLFLRYLYLPPGPTAVGSGGIFALFLFIFPAAPVYHFLKLYNGVTVMRDWSLALLRHRTRLQLFSSGVGPELPICDCAAVLSSGSIKCA